MVNQPAVTGQGSNNGEGNGAEARTGARSGIRSTSNNQLRLPGLSYLVFVLNLLFAFPYPFAQTANEKSQQF